MIRLVINASEKKPKSSFELYLKKSKTAISRKSNDDMSCSSSNNPNDPHNNSRAKQ